MFTLDQIKIERIWESHLGGFYRYRVTAGGRMVLLTQGVELRDRRQVASVVAELVDVQPFTVLVTE